MYWLLGIDTVLRIAAALALFFIAVPTMATRRPTSLSRREWFWWCLGCGVVVLTLAGQLFTLLNIASTMTYLALLAAIVAVCRARAARITPGQWIAARYRAAVVFTLSLLDDQARWRSEVRTRIGERAARCRVWLHDRRRALAVWAAVCVAAAIPRFFRPFATANLGFSDTYVHLYLMRLLDQGRQVDPAWGPYPRGMHFLLLAIERLTNVDPVLLLNFFGAFSGVLITVAVAYTAQKLTGRLTAALIAGLIFAVMAGGPRQYFAFGGSVSSDNPSLAADLLSRTYSELSDAGEFDVLLTVFQRQTSTLPQELAIALLFPATLFLLDWFRRRDRWHLTGFAMCTAAIAAIHSGVVLPLAILCAMAAVAALIEKSATIRDVVRGAIAGAAAIAIGSTWLFGFIMYRHVGGQAALSAGSHVGSTTLYYFPFLRPFAGGNTGEVPREIAYMMLTPFLAGMLIASVILIATGFRARSPRGGNLIWIGASIVVLTGMHAASLIGIPEIVEVRRNVTWLAMAVAVGIAVAVVLFNELVPRRFAYAIPATVIAASFLTFPDVFGAPMRDKLLDYSGYGGTTYALISLNRELQPFTWTFVSYGQEYPMVLGRGFHLNGADFLERFDPSTTLQIPTPYVFIAVEKKAHRFQVNNWSTRFDRTAIEERLQTWCMVYRMTHRDMRVFHDDENVRVYEISRSEGRS